MWNEVGGNKIQQAQQPAQKKVHIEVPEKEKQTQQARV